MEGQLIEIIPYRGIWRGTSIINRYKEIESAATIAIALLQADSSITRIELWGNKECLRTIKNKNN